MSVASGHDYNVDDPDTIQGRDEIIPGSRNLAELRLERALEAIGAVTGRLLLPGAGAGRYARALARASPDLDVIAGDLSRVAVDEAADAGGPVRYLAMDAQSLPFADATFGAVVFFDLLEHVPEPERLLDECQRVLRDDGVLHLFVPLEAQPGTLYHLLRGGRRIPIHAWKRDHVGHIQRYRAEDVLRQVWMTGFTVTSTAWSFHAVGQVHDVIDYWHRERTSGGPGSVPLPAVKILTRAAFVATWRLAYLEDRLYSGPRLASGLHLTARRGPNAT